MTYLNIREIFDKVTLHLDGLGIRPQLSSNEPASAAELAEAEREIAGTLPRDLKSLYLEYANGFTFRWSVDDDFDNADERGCFELPDLPALIRYREPFRDSWAESLDLSDIPNPDLAADTVSKMRRWLAFWEEPNGDQFCIDLGDGKVVFNQHDWFDGGDGFNGHLAAGTFSEFVLSWSHVCFARPLGLYWPDTFSAQGINWNAENFDERYMIT
jgi:hypothetical protein